MRSKDARRSNALSRMAVQFWVRSFSRENKRPGYRFFRYPGLFCLYPFCYKAITKTVNTVHKKILVE